MKPSGKHVCPICLHPEQGVGIHKSKARNSEVRWFCLKHIGLGENFLKMNRIEYDKAHSNATSVANEARGKFLLNINKFDLFKLNDEEEFEMNRIWLDAYQGEIEREVKNWSNS